MKATVIHEFKGVPDGQVHPRTFKVGQEVTGDLARVALDEGWAENEALKAKKPSSNKALQPARNKSGLASQPAPVSRRKTAKSSRGESGSLL